MTSPLKYQHYQYQLKPINHINTKLENTTNDSNNEKTNEDGKNQPI